MPGPLHVYLWSLDAPVIIVPAPTGIVYCNQVNGCACVQEQLEGFLVPLPRIEASVFDPLLGPDGMGKSLRRMTGVLTWPNCD